MKTTQQAFEELLNSPNAAEKMGIKQEQIYILRNRLKAGKVSINKMEQHLTQAGYQVAMEKTWFHLDEFKNENGPVIEQLFKKYFSEYTKDEMNLYRLLDYIKEKQTPSFAPGGTITNSSDEVVLPKEYLKEKQQYNATIEKIENEVDPFKPIIVRDFYSWNPKIVKDEVEFIFKIVNTMDGVSREVFNENKKQIVKFWNNTKRVTQISEYGFIAET
jgi:hypothetical protein